MNYFSTSSLLHDNAKPAEDFASEYSETEIKEGILEAALEFVPKLGWTREAITAAAEMYGYPGVAHGSFHGSRWT